MAFDRTKPADTDYISASAANLRENFRALAEDTRLYGEGVPDNSAGQDGWRYKDTNNGKEYIKINGAWIEKYSRPSLPIGSVIAFPVDTVPLHFLECNGATISRETYSELFTAIGTTYGAGDGSTTFKIPDLRGEFIRGWDHGRGLDGTLDRAIATTEEDSISKADLLMTLHRSIGAASSAMPVVNGGNNRIPFNANGATGLYTPMTDTQMFDNAGNETRPHNVAMMYCIVYE